MSSSFKYWTDLVDDTGTPPADPLPNMVNADSGAPKTAPAPWVPYTCAGCNFGAVALAFGRILSNLTAVNPYTLATDKLTAALVGPVERDVLHMATGDSQRTPTLTMFAQPDYFLFTGAPNCSSPCITVPTTPTTSTFAWNHGGFQPEIATIWLGIVGSGVSSGGQDDSIWSDHKDVRPTMLTLVGLKYSDLQNGRVYGSGRITGAQKQNMNRFTFQYNVPQTLSAEVSVVCADIFHERFLLSFGVDSVDVKQCSTEVSTTVKHFRGIS